MKLSELLYDGEYRSAFVASDITITEIVQDSHKVTRDCLFVCLRGTRTDTHPLLTFVAAQGAAAALAEEGTVTDIPIDFPVFIVPSTRMALAFAWSRFCGNPQSRLTLVGITGTNGKTSTAVMLDTILRNGGYKTALVGTYSCTVDGIPYDDVGDGDSRLTTMTTPDPDILYPFLRRAADAGVTHVVMEVSSHALQLDKVKPIFFEIGIFTNLSPEHLDFHETMDAYGSAKARLFSQCRQAVLNCDDTFGASLAPHLPCPGDTCGVVWDGTVSATQIENLGSDGIRYFYKHGEIHNLVEMRIPGIFTVYNSMLALTAALHLGIKAGLACRALSDMNCVTGRMERISGAEDDILVYIDYAHTPAAMENLLKTARRFVQPGGKLTILFGCGGDRDRTKRAPMGSCADTLADYAVITSDNSRSEEATSIIRDILTGHCHPERRRVIVDRERAIRFAIRTAEKNDVILLTGKGHETYEIKKDGIHPFEERDIAKSALKDRSAGHTEHTEDTAI